MNIDRALFRSDALGDLLSVLRHAVVGDDFGAQALRAGEFDGRGILRHHNGRGHAQPVCGPGHALRVIAAGYGNNAARALLLAHVAQSMPGPADLEGADRLQAFGLHPNPRAFDFQRQEGGRRQDVGYLVRGLANAVVRRRPVMFDIIHARAMPPTKRGFQRVRAFLPRHVRVQARRCPATLPLLAIDEFVPSFRAAFLWLRTVFQVFHISAKPLPFPNEIGNGARRVPVLPAWPDRRFQT